MLVEVFRQKLAVSILAFLDHLKPKIFIVGQPWWPSYSTPIFKIFGSAPVIYIQSRI